MTLNEFNAFCILLPGTSGSVRRARHQWKAGGPKGRVFAIAASDGAGGVVSVLFRASDIAWDVLRDIRGCARTSRRAPAGQVWVESSQPGLSDKELLAYLEAAHGLAAAGLPKKMRREMNRPAGTP